MRPSLLSSLHPTPPRPADTERLAAGTGKSAFKITAAETTIFDYTVSSAESYGVMTVRHSAPLLRPGPAADAAGAGWPGSTSG